MLGLVQGRVYYNLLNWYRLLVLLPGFTSNRAFMEQMGLFPERSLYLHLPRHHDEQQRRSTPFTPAVQIAYALAAALEELAGETVDGRRSRFARASAIVRDGLDSAGLTLLLPPRLRSTTMTSVTLPREMRYQTLHDALRREGFVIYAGQGPLAASVFRVATMGDVSEGDYRRFVQALRNVVGGA